MPDPIELIEVEPFHTKARKCLSEREIDDLKTYIGVDPLAGTPRHDLEGILEYEYNDYIISYCISADRKSLFFLNVHSIREVKKPTEKQRRALDTILKRLRDAAIIMKAKDLWDWLKEYIADDMIP